MQENFRRSHYRRFPRFNRHHFYDPYPYYTQPVVVVNKEAEPDKQELSQNQMLMIIFGTMFLFYFMIKK